jgi:hypothetical protein
LSVSKSVLPFLKDLLIDLYFNNIIIKNNTDTNMLINAGTVNNSISSDALMFGGGQESLARLYFSSSGASSSTEDGVSDNRLIELAAMEALGCLIDYGILCGTVYDNTKLSLHNCVA